MSRKTVTVLQLAKAADLDVESALVALWEVGIEHVDAGSSVLSDSERRRAESLLDTVGGHQRKVSYWMDWLGLSRDELVATLADLGMTLAPKVQTVPKGSLRKLRQLPPREVTQVRVKVEPETKSIVVPAPDLTSGQVATTISFITVDEVMHVHGQLEEDFAAGDDPIYPIGCRDRGLLEGAVERHETQFGDQRKYPTVHLAGAALLHGLVHNHPFHNGNKRTALVALLVFLDRNNRVMESDQGELFQWMVRIAAHELLPKDRTYSARSDHEVLEISRWITKHTRAIKREERSISWRALAKLLRGFDCEITQQRGEKLIITRRVEFRVGRGIFSKKEARRLESFYVNTGDGREVPKARVRRIRQDLWLDEAHVVDSEAFYLTQREPDFFIQEYSRTLRRLARV